MDLQFAIVMLIFVVALAYVGRMIYRAIFPKNNGCASGCGKCAANFDSVPRIK